MSRESVSDILFTMRDKGVKIWADNGRLRYQASKGALTSQDIETLRTMREEILTALRHSTSPRTGPHLMPRLPASHVPLTFSQQYMWSFWDLVKRPSMRMVAAAVRLRGRLEVEYLRQSFERLFHRHESLRTRIVLVEGVPQQHIDDPDGYHLEVIELTGSSQEKREIEARRLASEIVHEPFYLDRGPLFAARLIKVNHLDHVLVVAADHTISDAASIGIVWRDVFSMYTQFVRGQPCCLPEMPVQFADYAVWQRKTHPLWTETHGPYWERHLTGATRVRLFAGEKVACAAGVKWATVPIRFGEILSKGLLEVSRRQRTSMVMSVLTVFVSLILRWCNTTDLVFPFTTMGRSWPEVHNTIGFFGTPLLLRVEMSDGESFLGLLARVTQEYVTACEHDDSYRTAAQIHPPFALNPPFNWVPKEFNMSPDGSSQALEACTISLYELDIIPRADFECDSEPRVDFSDTPDGIVGIIGYWADRATQDSVKRFGKNLLFFAEKLVQEPMTRINEIELLKDGQFG